jgi:hypothetical protein
MPGINDRRGEETAPHQESSWSGLAIAPSDFESLVNTITFNGNLAALLACVCEKALEYEPPSHADPGHAPHPGVQAAIRAFAASKRVEGQAMATDTRQNPDHADPIPEEPETLPLTLAGKWVAWSSDGMRIVAAAETSIEAEQLAIDSGEPEPILERHPGRYRL